MSDARRERFERLCTAVTVRLPGRLSEVVAPTMVGFVAINGFAFLVDLMLMTVFRSGLRWPLWVAVGVAYAIALSLSFVLNRMLNFRTHRSVGPQFGVYVLLVAVNYAGVVVGVTSGLAALGVVYPVARLSAGLIEAVVMYSGMRWLVFRDRPIIRRR